MKHEDPFKIDTTQSQPEDEPLSKKRSSEYGEILDKIYDVVDLSERAQEDFIENRISNLSKDNKSKQPLGGPCIYEGFLEPERNIFLSLLLTIPFRMDDPDLYKIFLQEIKEFKEIGWTRELLPKVVPKIVQRTIVHYFGGPVTKPNAKMERDKTFGFGREVSIDEPFDDSKISIKELKGKNIALCAERAAAAQNLLKFLGIESKIIFSPCRIPAESKEDIHAYILVHGPHGDKIYDPTNPFLVFDDEGKIIDYEPALYSLSEEQLESLASEGVTVEHRNYKKNKNGEIIPIKSEKFLFKISEFVRRVE